MVDPLDARYDENGWYYNSSGTPTDPPAAPQGKNRGFAMPTQPAQGYNTGYQGGYKGGYSRNDNTGYQQKGSGGYSSGGDYQSRDRYDRNQGNRRNNYNNRNRRRRYDDDDDDDPVLKEFGGDYGDDDYLEEVTTNKEDQEKLERAFQLEQKAEKLNIFLTETILKDKISFTIEFVKIKSDGTSIVDGARELLKQKLPEAVLEPKAGHNPTGSSLTAKVVVKTKEQAHSLLNLEGESLQNIRVEEVHIPVIKPEEEEADLEPKDDEDGEEEDDGEEEIDDADEDGDPEAEGDKTEAQPQGTN